MCAEKFNSPDPEAPHGNPMPLRTSPPPPPPLTRHLGAIPMPPAGRLPLPPKRQATPGTAGATSEFVPRSRHRTILDSLYEAVLVTDYSGMIVEVNARAESMTQVSQLDLVQQPISAIVPTLSGDIIRRAIEHLHSTNHAVMGGWCLQLDGNRLRVEIAVSRMATQNRTELVFSLRNNTRQYTANLQHLNESLMLQHVACGIALVDNDSCIHYVNTAFVQIWRHDDQESLIGKKAQDLWPADVAALLVEPLTSTKPWSGEITVTLPDGTALSFQANSMPYQDIKGATEGVVVSFIDITSLKSAEETIRREAELQMETVRHEGNFAGSLNILSIPDLLQLITSSNKTGTLEVMDGQNQEVSFASFDNGRLVCVACGDATGEGAVVPMLEKGGRSFRFLQDTIRHRDPAITHGTMAILLDALRIIDEKNESGNVS